MHIFAIQIQVQNCAILFRVPYFDSRNMAANIAVEVAAPVLSTPRASRYDWSLQANCGSTEATGDIIGWPIQCWYDVLRFSCVSDTWIRYVVYFAMFAFAVSLLRKVSSRVLDGTTNGALYLLSGCCCCRPCRRRCCGGRCLFEEERETKGEPHR